MIINDTNIFFDRLGNKLIKVGKDVEFGFGNNNCRLVVEKGVIFAGKDRIDCEKIGAFSFINEHVTIRGTGEIGRFCSIAPNVYIGLVDHPTECLSSSCFFYDKKMWGEIENDFNNKQFPVELKKDIIQIGNDVWIGMGAKIMRGVNIGSGSIIAAGAVVTKDVEPYSIVGGVPAKLIKYRFDKETIEKLLKCEWCNIELEEINKINIRSVDCALLDEITENKEKAEYESFCIDVRNQCIVRNDELGETKIYDANYSEIKCGGISLGGITYNEREKHLQIRGWFLPSYAYDDIKIFVDDMCVGNASKHMLRRDVEINNALFADSRAGFNYDGVVDMTLDNYEIIVKCYKNNRIIKQTKGIILEKYIKKLIKELKFKDLKKYFKDKNSVAIINTSNKVKRENILPLVKEFEANGIDVNFNIESDVVLQCEVKKEYNNNEIPVFVLSCIKDGGIEYSSLRKISWCFNIPMYRIIEWIQKLRGKRKILAFYGNCQIMSYNSLILTSNILQDENDILVFPPVQSFGMSEKENGIDKELLNRIDIFIYQKVKDENSFSKHLSTDKIKSQLQETATLCCIPNVFFTGYFPQYCKNKYNPSDTGIVNGPCPYGDRNIEEMWNEYTYTEISSFISNEDFYSKKQITENAKQSLLELKNRETECDVRISDFIENNYRNNYIFYTPNRPTNIVLLEVLNRVFSFFELEINDILLSDGWENNGREMFIYPSVVRHLRLDFAKDKYCYLRQINKDDLSMEEYVYDYIYFCRP